MMLSEQEINERIDEIQQDIERVSAEARNALHACRPGHPLGKDKDRCLLFRNAAFVLGGRSGVSSSHIQWLNKTANQFHPRNAA